MGETIFLYFFSFRINFFDLQDLGFKHQEINTVLRSFCINQLQTRDRKAMPINKLNLTCHLEVLLTVKHI